MEMRSQWQCLLENLGNWQGSFAQLSAQGILLEEVKSETILEGLAENKTIRQTIRQFYEGATKERVLEYSNLARSVLFFETGAFSQGSIQFAPFSEFGAELGLIDAAKQNRLRLVQLFDQAGSLNRFTLIREQLAGSLDLERPKLSPQRLELDQLLGTWQGQAVTLYADWRSPDQFDTKLELNQLDPTTVSQKLSFLNQEISSLARIESDRLLFGDNSNQVLFLSAGASATCPLQLKLRQPFFLEVGWLMASNLRQRLMRTYDASGAWVSLTLVTEQKI